MRRALPILALLVLSACVAITVERHPPRKGPVKEVGYVEFGGGQVRYSSEGWAWVVASRRKLALKLMRANCGRDLDPKITDEYTRQDADASYNGEDIDSSMSIGDQHYVIENYVHLAYECVPRAGAPETALSTATVHASSATFVVPEVSASSSTLVRPEIPK
jgi:hypothetical protein